MVVVDEGLARCRQAGSGHRGKELAYGLGCFATRRAVHGAGLRRARNNADDDREHRRQRMKTAA
jgi:hypothetical protein